MPIAAVSARPRRNRKFRHFWHNLIYVKARRAIVRTLIQMWQPISTAPFACALELAVIDGDGPHALVFPCQRILNGWMNAETEERLDVHPTHWRQWDAAGSGIMQKSSPRA